MVGFFRLGILPLIVGTWFAYTLESFPLTFDFSVWYGGRTLIGLISLVGLAVYGFRVSLAGRPALRAPFLE